MRTRPKVFRADVPLSGVQVVDDELTEPFSGLSSCGGGREIARCNKRAATLVRHRPKSLR